MTATVETFYSIKLTNGGNERTFGSYVTPATTRSLSSGTVSLLDRAQIAAATKYTPWAYTTNKQFQILGLRIVGASEVDGSGFLHVGLYIDTPTSSTDPTPTGTYGRWRTFGLSCGEPLIINTQSTYIDPTPANDYTSTSSYPTLWASATDATRLSAKIYKVAVWNSGSTVVDSLETLVLW